MILASLLLAAISVLQSEGTFAALSSKKRSYQQMNMQTQRAMSTGNSQPQATSDNCNKQCRLSFRDRSSPGSDVTLNCADSESMPSAKTREEGSADSKDSFRRIEAPLAVKETWRESMQIYNIVLMDTANCPQPGPRLEYSRNHDEDPVTFLGGLAVGDLVGSSISSVVYNATADNLVGKALVVKYTNDCLARSGNLVRSRFDNNTVKEFGLLSVLARSNVAPVAYHLSGETVMTQAAKQSMKVRSKRMDRRIDICASIGTRVRYMVEDRMGPTFSKYINQMYIVRPDNTDLLKDVLSFGVRMIDMVRKMHNLGVIHGDIHAGNVVFRDLKDSLNGYRIGSDDIALIDFGMGEFFPSRFSKPELTKGPADNLNLIHLSPWQLKGYRTGMRDDIYRIAELLANILSENEFQATLKAKVADARRDFQDIVEPMPQSDQILVKEKNFRNLRNREIEVLLEKKSGSIFDGCLEIWGIDESFHFLIETRLGLFQRRILAMDNPDKYPPYQNLIDDLESIIKTL